MWKKGHNLYVTGIEEKRESEIKKIKEDYHKKFSTFKELKT